MSPVSGANLIAATLNLQLTDSVLRAIRAADRFGAVKLAAAIETPIDRFCCGPIWRHPCYLPRPVILPTTRYLPRPVIHPRPRIGEPWPLVPPPCPEMKPPHITPGPPPPWKTEPGKELPPAPSVIKVYVHRPDTVSKGALVDLFL